MRTVTLQDRNGIMHIIRAPYAMHQQKLWWWKVKDSSWNDH